MSKEKWILSQIFDIFVYNFFDMSTFRIKYNPKIKVTSNGGFYVKSEDIFSDRVKSRKQINDLKAIVKKYKVKG